MTALDFLCSITERPTFASMERPGYTATRSEVRRWLRQGSVLFNSEQVGEIEEIDFPIISLVIHPKNPKRVTLW